MTRSRTIPLALVATVLATARLAGADLTGPYTGSLLVKRSAQTVAVAAALTQSGRTLSGTVVLGGSDPVLAGAYIVSGAATGKRLHVSGGNPSGARLVWRGTVGASGPAGRLRVHGGGSQLAGKLSLTLRTSSGDGTSCDAVYNQNQTFFAGQVMDQVLVPICGACHVPGGQAQATRLHVVRGDPLATARSVALLVDVASPVGSLLLQKPTAAVPHGGGQQIMPGSPPEQILSQWASLIAQAKCAPQTSTTPATALFVQDCAGCHGTDGAGGSGPDVRCAARSLLADAVRRGRGQTMPAFPLAAADLNTIAGYLDARCSHQPADVYAANCAGCHGATAGGGRNADGVVGPNIRCNTEDFVEAVTQGSDGMPAFPSFGGGLVGRLAAWVGGFCRLGGGGGDG